MRRRFRMKKRKSKRLFRRTVGRIHKKNLIGVHRGGNRL